MTRRNKFIIGFAAAALTYGTLFATMGPRHFGHRNWGKGWNHNEHHGGCNKEKQYDYNAKSGEPDQVQPGK